MWSDVLKVWYQTRGRITDGCVQSRMSGSEGRSDVLKVHVRYEGVAWHFPRVLMTQPDTQVRLINQPKSLLPNCFGVSCGIVRLMMTLLSPVNDRLRHEFRLTRGSGLRSHRIQLGYG